MLRICLKIATLSAEGESVLWWKNSLEIEYWILEIGNFKI